MVKKKRKQRERAVAEAQKEGAQGILEAPQQMAGSNANSLGGVSLNEIGQCASNASRNQGAKPPTWHSKAGEGSLASAVSALSLKDDGPATANQAVDQPAKLSISCAKSEELNDGYGGRYFSHDANFTPDYSTPFHEEFDRFAKMKGWNDKTCRVEKRKAALQEFEYLLEHYLSASNEKPTLEALQNLCTVLDINPPPESKNKCKKAIEEVYVNIYDFINCLRAGIIPVQPVFHNYRQFRRRTLDENMIFPKAVAKKSSIIKMLLEQIVS